MGADLHRTYNALKFHNRMGAMYCPCGCWDEPIKVVSYVVDFALSHTRHVDNPEIDTIYVECDVCGKRDHYRINGKLRMNDFDF